MRRKTVRLDARVESEIPPIQYEPALPHDLSGFGNIDELVKRLVESEAQFPFQRELALYLLFIASFWPGNAERLLVAARIFSGALSFRISGSGRGSKSMKPLRKNFSVSKLRRFNRSFFARIGGAEVLLFCPSVQEFHREVWARFNALAMMHDVIDFIVKTADFPELCSSKMAFEAVAGNIFERQGGYGISSGAKRKHKAGYVTSPETVRAEWKEAPATILLSYALTYWSGVHYFDAADPRFFSNLNRIVESGPDLGRLLAVIQERIHLGKATQNASLSKWLRPDIPRLSGNLYFKPLTEAELDRALELRNNSQQFKIHLTPEREAELRAHRQTWLKNIPRATP